MKAECVPPPEYLGPEVPRHLLRRLQPVETHRLNCPAIARVVLPLLLLSALFGLACVRLAPQLPLALLWIMCIFGLVPLLGLLWIAPYGELTLGQTLMLRGGTDPEWYLHPPAPLDD